MTLFRSVCMHFWPKLCGFVASSPQILEYFLGTITCLLAKRKEDTRWGEIFFTFFLIHSNYWDCAVDHIRSSTDHPPFFLNAKNMKQTLNVKIDLIKYGYNGKHGPKWVLIVWPKITQMPHNLSAQFVCASSKFLNFIKKGFIERP